MEPALAEAESALESTQEQLHHSKNALADCQEMLEELQAFSEEQSQQILALQADMRAVGGVSDP